MQQKIIDLYDSYTHGGMSRRSFLDRLAMLAGGTAAATALLPILENNYAHADTVAENDPRVKGEMVTFKAGSQDVSGYLVQPAADGKYPSVVVVHENRGLNPHTKDVARRLAVDGFQALAVDFLSPIGGTPSDQDKAREMIGTLQAPDVTGWAQGAVAYLRGTPSSNGKVGAVGFCWGGGVIGRLGGGGADAECRRGLLRPAASGRGGCEDQGAAAAELCRDRRAHQWRHPRL